MAEPRLRGLYRSRIADRETARSLPFFPLCPAPYFFVHLCTEIRVGQMAIPCTVAMTPDADRPIQTIAPGADCLIGRLHEWRLFNDLLASETGIGIDFVFYNSTGNDELAVFGTTLPSTTPDFMLISSAAPLSKNSRHVSFILSKVSFSHTIFCLGVDHGNCVP